MYLTESVALLTWCRPVPTRIGSAATWVAWHSFNFTHPDTYYGCTFWLVKKLWWGVRLSTSPILIIWWVNKSLVVVFCVISSMTLCWWFDPCHLVSPIAGQHQQLSQTPVEMVQSPDQAPDSQTKRLSNVHWTAQIKNVGIGKTISGWNNLEEKSWDDLDCLIAENYEKIAWVKWWEINQE